ncbi:MAG: cation transporter [Melioribacteraceae bacterium]
MEEIKLMVEGMNCQHCVKAVEVELEELDLDSYTVEIGKVTAKFDSQKINVDLIKNAITEAGYRVL